MKRWLSRLFKGSGFQSSRRQDESSDRSSADVPMEDTGTEPQLLTDSDLDLVGGWERQAYGILKDRVFTHTRVYDPELLWKKGMDVDFWCNLENHGLACFCNSG
jgi:hypothetical protein